MNPCRVLCSSLNEQGLIRRQRCRRVCLRQAAVQSRVGRVRPHIHYCTSDSIACVVCTVKVACCYAHPGGASGSRSPRNMYTSWQHRTWLATGHGCRVETQCSSRSTGWSHLNAPGLHIAPAPAEPGQTRPRAIDCQQPHVQHACCCLGRCRAHRHGVSHQRGHTLNRPQHLPEAASQLGSQPAREERTSLGYRSGGSWQTRP